MQDPKGRTGWPKDKGRDGERTPMQWNSGKNAGFSNGLSTWLPVAPDFTTVNVEREMRDPDSLLNYYKKLIRLRKQNAQLRDGDFAWAGEQAGGVLSFFRRTAGGGAVLVALNFSATPATINPEGISGKRVETLLASFPNARFDAGRHLTIPAYRSFVGQVKRR